jgi:D-serine dehydratase
MVAAMTAEDPLDAPIGGLGTKGWPPGEPPLRRRDLAARRWNVLRGDLPLPLAVIRRDALHANLRWMQAFAHERGLELAPHGKTTMSPQLFRAQLDAGAWGLTVANLVQAQVAVAAGARRVLVANQVLADVDLAAAAALRRAQADLGLCFLVDSLAQLGRIEAWHARGPDDPPPFDVLLEIGLDGGRTGCRTHDAAIALARRLHASRATRLVGIECYEGLWATGRGDDDRALADGLMQRVAAVARQCDAEGLFDADDVLLSAGGSAIFDLVAPGLRLQLSRPVRGILRSGCYVTHDHGNYKRYLAAMDARLGCGHGLQAALEVWANVQSCPEPGLAILSAGKRDASYDIELPIPARWWRDEQRLLADAPDGWSIRAMNDQHAYLRFDPATAPAPQVGDRIGLGISHPCTTFDKWRWLAVVDDGYDVVDAVTTAF